MPPTPDAPERPYVETIDPPGAVRAVALVLHGGKATDIGVPKARSLSLLRVRPFWQQIAAAGADDGVAGWLLRYRHPGWNGVAADAARDTVWALREVVRRHGPVPVVLVGHSMGGRAALRVVGSEGVRGAVGLAPWTPPGEPIADLTDRTVLIAHGTRDRWVDNRMSLDYALRAKRNHPGVARFEVAGVGHAMVRRASDWHAFARNAALGILGLEPFWPLVANAMHEESPAGLRVPLVVPRSTARAARPT